MKAKFIDIEGGEGSGKSVALNTLRDYLGSSGYVFTREPGGTPYAEVIRDVALTNSLSKSAPAKTTLSLMFASRFEHGENLIIPSLNGGKTVITDRYDASSYAYNVWAQSNGILEPFFWYQRSQLDVLPGMYIWLDVDPETGMRRAQARNLTKNAPGTYDHFDDRKLEFHKKVREGYLRFFGKKKLLFFQKVPYIRIDANLSLDEVKRSLLSVIKQELKLP